MQRGEERALTECAEHASFSQFPGQNGDGREAWLLLLDGKFTASPDALPGFLARARDREAPLHFSISCSGKIWGPTDLGSRVRKQKLSWSGGGWGEREERTNGNLAPPQQFSRNTHASQGSGWPLPLSTSPTACSLPSMLAS